MTELLRIDREEHYRRPTVFCHELSPTRPDAAAHEAERDPVCGMWINPETAAAKRTIHEKRLVFCSLQCAANFDDHPARFVAKETTP
jgi:Cu+-exporting ATPase